MGFHVGIDTGGTFTDLVGFDPDSGRAVRAARRTLRGAEVDVGDRPAVGEPITVEVSYRSVTDLPLVGPMFPDPTLHSRVSMRVEK